MQESFKKRTSNEFLSKSLSFKTEEEDDEDIPDMEDYEEEEDEATYTPAPSTTNASSGTPAASASSNDMSNSNILQTRTYDVMISYDKYYQTPRVWLYGYDENRAPLKAEQMLEGMCCT